MYLVFVYGTLKQGFSNNRLLRNCRYKDATASGIELHNGPGFPYAMRGEGITYGELYEVNDETLASLDALEGHPIFYNRELTPVQAGGTSCEAWVYLNQRAASYSKIESGLWE